MKYNFWKSITGIGEILAILLFLLGLVAFLSFGDQFSNLGVESTSAKVMLFFGGLYVGAQLLATLIDFLQGRHKATLKNFFILWRSYLFMTFIHLLLFILAIPLLALLFLMGPVAFIGGLIAIGTLCIYVIHTFLNYEMVAHPPLARDALWALLFLFVCSVGFFLMSRITKGSDDLMDKFSDHFEKIIYRPAQSKNEKWLGQLDP